MIPFRLPIVILALLVLALPPHALHGQASEPEVTILNGTVRLGGDASARVLVFVDGRPTDWQAAQELGVESIESVEVVRGTAAERLYGPEASDGVILVTTGSSGNQAVAGDAPPAGIRIIRGGGIDWSSVPEGVLIVVDGDPVEGAEALQDLRAEDVDQIEVIRGSAAGRLYGSSAEEGVIVITTSSGTR